MRNSSSALTETLQSTAPNNPPFLEDSTLARLFRNGTEMGLLGLTDSAKHLLTSLDWVGPGRYPTLHSSKDGDIVRGVLELLHHRVNLGFPTFLVKVRAHKGEPYNEAYTATNDEDVPLLWNDPAAVLSTSSPLTPLSRRMPSPLLLHGVYE
jgi:hypothetical protein